jgi:hypothetical protein
MIFCQFCAHANCKNCSKKTRFYYDDTQMNESLDLSRSNKSYFPDQNRPKGKICTMCDRKFHINKILCSSFKAIDAQNMTLDNVKR